MCNVTANTLKSSSAVQFSAVQCRTALHSSVEDGVIIHWPHVASLHPGSGKALREDIRKNVFLLDIVQKWP